MIKEIKTIVDNYLNAKKLPCVMSGKYKDFDVIVNEKLTIPSELLHIPTYINASEGDDLLLLRDLGGQKFIVLDVMKDDS